MAESMLLITHADGRNYAVSEAAYKATYEGEGFSVERHEDGSPYPAPVDPIVGAVGEKAAASLAAAGYGDAASIAKADDEALLAVPGIGQASVEKLRAIAPHAPQDDPDETEKPE